MRLLVAALFVSAAMAGCTSGDNNLAKFTIMPGELPDGYSVVPIDDPEWSFFFEFAGMTTNPGTGDPMLLEEDARNVTSVYLAVYDFGGNGSLISGAVLFTSPEHATAFAMEQADCEDGGEEGILIKGAIVSLTDTDGVPEREEGTLLQLIGKIAARTGATHPCQMLA